MTVAEKLELARGKRTIFHRQRMPREVWMLVVGRFVNRLGAFTLAFLAPFLSVTFHASIATAGALVSLFGLATIPSRLAGGWLCNWLGYKTTIAIGLTVTAIAQLGLAASSNLHSAIGFVVLLGLAFEVYEAPSQALIAVVVVEQVRPAAYGLLSAALAAAGICSGLFAVTVGGVDLRLLFVADAVTCILCAVLLVSTLPSRKMGKDRTDRTSQREIIVRSPWRDGHLMALLAVGIGFATLYFQISANLPLTLLLRGLNPVDFGILVMVAGSVLVAGQPLLRRWSWIASRPFETMAIGYMFLAVGLLANGYARTLPGFIAATVVSSFGDLILMGQTYALVARLATSANMAKYMSVFGLSWGIGITIGPGVGAQILERGGPVALWTSTASLCVLLAIMQYVLRPRMLRRWAFDKSAAQGAPSEEEKS